MSESAAELSRLVQTVIEPYLLDGPRRYTRAEVAQRSGVPPELARRLWVALGFPANPDDEAVVFTDADIAALRAFLELYERQGPEAVAERHHEGPSEYSHRTQLYERQGPEAVAERHHEGPSEYSHRTQLDFTTVTDVGLQVSAARTLGQAMARLAEWQVDLVVEEIKAGLARSGGDPADSALATTERTVAVLTQLQRYAWRRHLAAALGRAAGGDFGDASTGSTIRPLLVGFADMVGYTRLTRHLAADELAELLETFETLTTEVITAGGGWVIKNVGDEVMFAAESAADGAAVGLAIQDRMNETARQVTAENAATGRERQLPQLRVGLAYGPVLQRFGDLYGSVVNTAARLTGVARPGTVLVDDQVAESIVGDSRFTLRHLRSVRVRGINRLRSHVLRHNRR
jgi:adenylate cyclase